MPGALRSATGSARVALLRAFFRQPRRLQGTGRSQRSQARWRRDEMQWNPSGFSVWLGEPIEPEEEESRSRLTRYVVKAPVALERGVRSGDVTGQLSVGVSGSLVAAFRAGLSGGPVGSRPGPGRTRRELPGTMLESLSRRDAAKDGGRPRGGASATATPVQRSRGRAPTRPLEPQTERRPFGSAHLCYRAVTKV